MPAFEFHPADLQRLRRLTFSARLTTTAGTVGPHRVRHGGEGMEFFDYRPYATGDDFRRIDWALFGRLRELVVRVTQAEECLYVSLLVDISRSMDFGSPCRKVELACQLASALSYVALVHGDRTQLATFAAELGPIRGPFQGIAQLGCVVDYLREVTVGGTTSMEAAATEFCRRRAHRGLTILISDFLGDPGYEAALNTLMRARERVLVIQVLDDLDWGIGLDGHFQLRDSETGRAIDVLVDPAVRRRMRRRVEAFTERIVAFCRQRQQQYLLARTQDRYLELVAQALRERVVLR
ncbi:MAG: DUF58 domain-containing protein [Planctomycetota bacterium]